MEIDVRLSERRTMKKWPRQKRAINEVVWRGMKSKRIGRKNVPEETKYTLYMFTLIKSQKNRGTRTWMMERDEKSEKEYWLRESNWIIYIDFFRSSLFLYIQCYTMYDIKTPAHIRTIDTFRIIEGNVKQIQKKKERERDALSFKKDSVYWTTQSVLPLKGNFFIE